MKTLNPCLTILFSVLTISLSAQARDTVSSSLSFGSNFDFLDGIRATEIYADFRFDAPIISSSRFGLEVGITNQRTITFQDTTIERNYYDVFPNLDTAGQVIDLDYVTIGTKGSMKEQIENLGVNVTPKFLLFPGPSGDKESRLYLVGNMEVIRSKTEFSSTVSVIRRDTSEEPNIPIPYDLSEVPAAGVSRYTTYHFYGGLGVEYQHRDKNADFKLRILPGYRYLSNRQIGLDTEGLKSTSFFYLAQMEVLEKRVAGIKLGIEIRGGIGGQQSFPWVSVFIAKQFSLNKLAEIFKPS